MSAVEAKQTLKTTLRKINTLKERAAHLRQRHKGGLALLAGWLSLHPPFTLCCLCLDCACLHLWQKWT